MCAGGEEGGDECEVWNRVSVCWRCEGEAGECVQEVKGKRESVCRRCEGRKGFEH